MKKNKIYVDTVSLVSAAYCLYWLRSLEGNSAELWYFDGVSPLAKALLRISTVLGIGDIQLRQIDYCWGHLRSDKGIAVWHEVANGDMELICDGIRSSELECSDFLRALGQFQLEHKRLLAYIEKRIYAEMMEVAVPINVAARHSSGERSHCLLSSRRWKVYVCQYGAKKNVEIAFYPSLSRRFLKDCLRMGLLSIRRLPRACWTGVKDIAKQCFIAKKKKQGAKLAIAYGGWDITGDLSKRHDLFWWHGSKIEPDNVLVYCTRADLALTEREMQYLTERKIRVVATNSASVEGADVPLWHATWRFYAIAIRLWSLVWRTVFANMVRSRRKPSIYFRDLCSLIFDFSYWYDFFKTNEVRANVNYAEFVGFGAVGNVLALRWLNGINVSYQGSNLYDASIDMMPSADVVFAYSPAFAKLWASHRVPAINMVYTGYIFDGVFEQVKARSSARRADLEREGAEFIIAYFDENSSSSRDAIISNEDSEAVYVSLLQALLADEALGLIIKPKKARNLRERISGAEQLMKAAIETGRMHMIDDRSVYPAEVAMASDIAIGELVGTTAALEAYLAGTPAILVDALGMISHPYYIWGEGSVAFRDWPEALQAIEQYRAERNSISGFGNWTSIIDELDPFRDGHAAARMAEYMSALWSGLCSGETRAAAIAAADRLYVEKWGKQSVFKSWGQESASRSGVLH